MWRPIQVELHRFVVIRDAARREVLGKAQPADVVDAERAETRDRDSRRGRDDPVAAAPARAEWAPVASAVSSMLVVREGAAEKRRGCHQGLGRGRTPPS